MVVGVGQAEELRLPFRPPPPLVTLRSGLLARERAIGKTEGGFVWGREGTEKEGDRPGAGGSPNRPNTDQRMHC